MTIAAADRPIYPSTSPLASIGREISTQDSGLAQPGFDTGDSLLGQDPEVSAMMKKMMDMMIYKFYTKMIDNMKDAFR